MINKASNLEIRVVDIIKLLDIVVLDLLGKSDELEIEELKDEVYKSVNKLKSKKLKPMLDLNENEMGGFKIKDTLEWLKIAGLIKEKQSKYSLTKEAEDGYAKTYVKILYSELPEKLQTTIKRINQQKRYE